MRVLVTGGLGLVGRAVVAGLLAEGHTVRVFDTGRVPRRMRNRRLETVHGDLCNIADVSEAVRVDAHRGVDAVVHLAAVIPPAADRDPTRAGYVNVGGTVNVIRAMSEYAPAARLVFASSIAVYGDRRNTPPILVSDEMRPGSRDSYAAQKVSAEDAIRRSNLSWVILRLSYIVSAEKLRMDPLMYHMPLETRIETCSAGDAARALIAAITVPEAVGRTFNVAGGEACRTTYRDYLATMVRLFGLLHPLPESAFTTDDFHCGHMDTTESESILHFQSDTLGDYYATVARRSRAKRIVLQAMPLLRALVRRKVVSASPYWQAHRTHSVERFPAGSRLWVALRLVRKLLAHPGVQTRGG